MGRDKMGVSVSIGIHQLAFVSANEPDNNKTIKKSLNRRRQWEQKSLVDRGDAAFPF